MDPKDSCEEERESELLLVLLRLDFLCFLDFFLCFRVRSELNEDVSPSERVVADSCLEEELVLRILDSWERTLSLSDWYRSG